MSDLITEIGPQRAFTNLLHYLNQFEKKIIWNKYCSKDGRNFYGEELKNNLDSTYFTTHYFSNPLLGINLEYNINWKEKNSSFVLKNEQRRNIGLNPQIENIVIFSHNTDEVNDLKELPLFQLHYDVFSSPTIEDAKKTIHDFSQTASILAKYFDEMQNDSLIEYFKLIEKVQTYNNNENIIRFS